MEFSRSDKNKNRRLRRERFKKAKMRGDHSYDEWKEMMDFFEYTCVNCFGESGLKYVEKDHIIPLYQGGSNHIRNIQPMCAKCNAGKGDSSKDLRPVLSKRLGKKLPDNYKNPF